MSFGDLSIDIAKIKPWPVCTPISVPRRNAFGTMNMRPALFVELHLRDGTVGWGEVFCNWPAFTNLHRAKLISKIFTSQIENRHFSSPSELWKTLTANTHAVSVQSGEPGPFAATIAGLEIAAWDAVARRANKPLWSMFAEKPAPVHPYASGLTSETLEELVPSLLDKGWNAFKLKVGFGRSHDETALYRLRQLVGPKATIMVDANQCWDISTAIAAVEWLNSYDVKWVEEPISIDSPIEQWEAIVSRGLPIGVGENHRGVQDFTSLVSIGVKVLQPDPIKWGGLSQCIQVSKVAAHAEIIFAPHYLGGGVGLAATLHLCSATNAAWLEVDVTENKLRDAVPGVREWIDRPLSNEKVLPLDSPGHGATPSQKDVLAGDFRFMKLEF